MISTKIDEPEPEPIVVTEVKNGDTPVVLQPEKEYHSFLENFLKTNNPSIDLQVKESRGFMCASSTMLINISFSSIQRLVFHRQSCSEFKWDHYENLDVRWSSWLQQFIALTKFNIVAIDAIEKQNQIVVTQKHYEFKYITH